VQISVNYQLAVILLVVTIIKLSNVNCVIFSFTFSCSLPFNYVFISDLLLLDKLSARIAIGWFGG